jgi:biopolymer transport protein ExbD
MAVSPFSDDDDDGVMSEINMTPQVDVMLVLLIIFLVTVPVMQHVVKIDLPHTSSQPEDVKPAHVDVSIRADGTVLWGKQVVDDATLRAKIAEAALASPHCSPNCICGQTGRRPMNAWLT